MFTAVLLAAAATSPSQVCIGGRCYYPPNGYGAGYGAPMGYAVPRAFAPIPRRQSRITFEHGDGPRRSILTFDHSDHNGHPRAYGAPPRPFATSGGCRGGTTAANGYSAGAYGANGYAPRGYASVNGNGNGYAPLAYPRGNGNGYAGTYSNGNGNGYTNGNGNGYALPPPRVYEERAGPPMPYANGNGNGNGNGYRNGYAPLPPRRMVYYP